MHKNFYHTLYKYTNFKAHAANRGVSLTKLITFLVENDMSKT